MANLPDPDKNRNPKAKRIDNEPRADLRQVEMLQMLEQMACIEHQDRTGKPDLAEYAADMPILEGLRAEYHARFKAFVEASQTERAAACRLAKKAFDELGVRGLLDTSGSYAVGNAMHDLIANVSTFIIDQLGTSPKAEDASQLMRELMHCISAEFYCRGFDYGLEMASEGVKHTLPNLDTLKN